MTSDAPNVDKSQDDRSMTRARKWVQKFYAQDEGTFSELGETFECYLNHVDEFESQEFDYQDLPSHFTVIENALIHTCVLFGIQWAKSDATLHVVLAEDDVLVGLYAHQENAERVLETHPNHRVDAIEPRGVNLEQTIEDIVNAESGALQDAGECLKFLKTHHEELKEGELEAEDFPTDRPQSIKWMMVYSALFGRIWEFSHPAFWSVLGDGGTFEGLFGSLSRAEDVAEEEPDRIVQRVNVQDGDLPNHVVINQNIHQR